MAAWVFMDGFSRSLTSQGLVNLLQGLGRVRAVHIVRPSRLDFLPVAFIDMVTTKAAKEVAEALHNSMIRGRRLRVVALDENRSRPWN
jgi:hypothetical protein